jgi:hypothetical protein
MRLMRQTVFSILVTHIIPTRVLLLFYVIQLFLWLHIFSYLFIYTEYVTRAQIVFIYTH